MDVLKTGVPVCNMLGYLCRMAREAITHKSIFQEIARRSGRSSLFWWMVEHHDEMVEQAAGQRMQWTRLRALFAEQGLTDCSGKPATKRNARQTWAQARAHVANLRARRKADEGLLESARQPVPPERLPLNWVPAGVITTETSGTLRGAGVEMDVTLCAGESSATATGQFLPTFSSAWNCALQVGDATHGGVAESVISTAGAPVTMSVIVTIPAPPATKIPLEASPGTSLMVIPSETLPETALVDVSAIVPFSYSVPDVQQPAPITHPTAGGPDHPVFIPGPLNSPDPNIRMAAVLAEQDDWDDRKRFPG